MTTVQELKAGATLPAPIYKELPYVILSNRDGIVLHAGTLESLKSFGDYYDRCVADVRRYDLHLNDNTKVEIPSALARFGAVNPVLSRMSAAELGKVLTDGIPHGWKEAGEMIVGVYHERTGQHAGGTCEICDLEALNRRAQAWLDEHEDEILKGSK